MTQLLIFTCVAIVIGVFAFMFLNDIIVRIIAVVFVAASIAVLSIPYLIASIGIWNDSMINLIQMFQIVIFFGGIALGFRRVMIKS